MPRAALSHLKVLDLTRFIAGPICTKLLAAMGAEVIKIEQPGAGDPARRLGPFLEDEPHPEKSGLFLYLNTGKKSVTLDLKSPTGRGIFKRLVQDTDILVESFAPRFLPSLGLEYEALEKINPRLIMTSVSNFGQSGPYRDYAATDLIAYALGGLLYSIGEYDREPVKHGLTAAQVVAGLNAAVGTLIALYNRNVTGEGQRVDVSLQEGVIGTMGAYAFWYAYMGGVMRRQPKSGSGFGNIMRCKDGYVVAMPSGDWDYTADFFAIPELKATRFASAAARAEHHAEIDALILPWLSQRGKHELFHAAQAWRLPWAMVQDARDLAGCPQLDSRRFFVEIDHPATGPVKYPGAPFDATATPYQVQQRAPLLGEQNEEVYCGRLGYSREDLATLAESGIV